MKKGWFVGGVIAVTLFLSGCETGNQRIGLVDQEQQKVSYAQTILEKQQEQPPLKDIKRMELESQKEIAKIEMQKAIEVEKVKAEVKKAEVESQKEIELMKAELRKQELEKEIWANKWIVILAVIFFFMMVLLIYKLFKDHQRLKMQLHKEKMAHEANLKERELQARVVEKMIEAVGEGKLTPEQHERLIASIQNPKQLPPSFQNNDH